MENPTIRRELVGAQRTVRVTRGRLSIESLVSEAAALRTRSTAPLGLRERIPNLGNRTGRPVAYRVVGALLTRSAGGARRHCGLSVAGCGSIGPCGQAAGTAQLHGLARSAPAPRSASPPSQCRCSPSTDYGRRRTSPRQGLRSDTQMQQPPRPSSRLAEPAGEISRCISRATGSRTVVCHARSSCLGPQSGRHELESSFQGHLVFTRGCHWVQLPSLRSRAESL